MDGETREAWQLQPTHIEQLERVLLRRGLGELEADRSSCADCGRTPLTGEHVHLYGGAPARAIVCELCRPAHREAPLASGSSGTASTATPCA